MSDKMSEYDQAVAVAANARDGRVVLNWDTACVPVILRHLFRVANGDVQILAMKLDNRVYGEENVVQTIVDYLKSNKSAILDIIVQSDVSTEDHPLLSTAKAEGLGPRIKLYKLNEHVASEMNENFTISEENGTFSHFRYEPNRNKHEAFVQFGNPIVSNQLHEKFEGLKYNSERVYF